MPSADARSERLQARDARVGGHRARRIFREHFECERLQRVADQHGHAFAVDFVASRTAAAQVVVVHGRQVVVHETVGMDDLDGRRRGIERLERRAERSARRIDEHRTQSFAAAEHAVAHRFAQPSGRDVLA